MSIKWQICVNNKSRWVCMDSEIEYILKLFAFKIFILLIYIQTNNLRNILQTNNELNCRRLCLIEKKKEIRIKTLTTCNEKKFIQCTSREQYKRNNETK